MRPMILLVGLGCLLSACSPGDQGPHRSTRGATGAEMSPEGGEERAPRAVRWLAVKTRSVSDGSTARQLGLPRVIRGALVERVIPRTPAARAGLSGGDVLTEIKIGKGRDQFGYSVESSAQLESVLMQLPHLRHFGVEVFRGPAPLNLSSYQTQLFQVRLQRN